MTRLPFAMSPEGCFLFVGTQKTPSDLHGKMATVPEEQLSSWNPMFLEVCHFKKTAPNLGFIVHFFIGCVNNRLK